MNNIESTRVYYNELAKFTLSLYGSLSRRENIENYNINYFGSSVRYVVPPDGKCMLSLVDNYQPDIASSVIEDRLEYCYITFDECLYGKEKFKHQDYNIDEDFFSLSTVYDLNVLKVIYIGSYIQEPICSTNIEQMLLIDIVMVLSLIHI